MLWYFRELCLVLVLIVAAPALSLESPFPSTIEGISIPNSHFVAKEKGYLLRGMMPMTRKQAWELSRYGVTHVLVFRNDSEGESAFKDEQRRFRRIPGIKSLEQIEFPWKKVYDYKKACRQSLQALRLIRTVLQTPGDGMFFHCTVGEDRTGYLAGLYRVIFENQDGREVFKREMCHHGYAEGDYRKPKEVAATIHRNLTPLYLKMLQLIEAGAISRDRLDDSACDALSSRRAAAKEFDQVLPKYRCMPRKPPKARRSKVSKVI